MQKVDCLAIDTLLRQRSCYSGWHGSQIRALKPNFIKLETNREVLEILTFNLHVTYDNVSPAPPHCLLSATEPGAGFESSLLAFTVADPRSCYLAQNMMTHTRTTLNPTSHQ